MSNWSETQLTAKGRALDAKVTAGLTTLTFTRMKIGSGNVTPEEIDTMTDLKSPRLVIGISSCEVSEADPTICSVIGVAKSNDVETSFLVKEQGLFATDPDDGEILYAVMIDSEPDKMPNKNVPSPLSIMYQINVVSDNASSITAVIDPAGLVTVQTMNAAINSHDTGATSHPLTIDDSVVPASNQGALATIMNNVANMLKQIKGDSDWKTTPVISLASILGNFATNLSVTTDPDTGVFTCASLGVTGLMAPNGYICLGKLFGGLILQWGSVTPTSPRVHIDYPIAFTTFVFFNIAFSTCIFTASTYNSASIEDTSTRTLQSCEYINVPNITSPYFRWLAIGK